MATPNEVFKATVNSSQVLKNEGIATMSLQEAGGVLLNYKPFMNEFINTLINKVFTTIISAKMFNNPLAVFKGPSVPQGTDVEEILANPAVATAYDANAFTDHLNANNTPDVFVAYFRRNRQDKFKAIVRDADLTGAFLSEQAFGRFVSLLMGSLTNGDAIEEFNLLKKVMTDAMDTNSSLTKYDADVNDPTTLVKALRKTFYDFQFPTSKFNTYKAQATKAGVSSPKDLITWSNPKDIYVILTSEMAAEVDVEVLAKAFNMDKANFMGRQIVIDSFGSGTASGSCQAIMLDAAALKCYDNLLRTVAAEYNAATMSQVTYLHHWQTLAFSPMANAISFHRGA